MTIGQIILNLFVLKLVLWFGKGDEAAGYQSTAVLLALLALPMFWAVAIMSKERITVKKEDQGKISDGLKLVFKNKNLLCAMMYSFFNMFGMSTYFRSGILLYALRTEFRVHHDLHDDADDRRNIDHAVYTKGDRQTRKEEHSDPFHGNPGIRADHPLLRTV